MISKLFTAHILKSILKSLKGASQWLIVLVAGVALGLTASGVEIPLVEQLAADALAIACTNTNG